MTAPDLSGRPILLMEPDRHSRLAHRDALVAAGYVVDEASDLALARRLAEVAEYGVILASVSALDDRSGQSLQQLFDLQAGAKYMLIGTDPLQLPRMGALDAKLAGVLCESTTASDLVAAVARAIHPHRDFLRLQIEGRAARVLVLEDDEHDAGRLCDLLRASGEALELRVVKRLGEGLAALASETFDVAMTDLTLPDARGFDAVSQLHAAASGLPIVVLASGEDDAFASEALDLGAQDYLSKQHVDDRQLLKTLRNAIERKRLERQLTRAAHYDALSGLANRVLFHDRLAHALARSRRETREFAVLFVDLDRFKAINDELGHEAGDALLRELGPRLRSAVRESDTVARLGGDEFALLLETTAAPAETAKAASRIIESISQPLQYRDAQLTVTASVGIATYPRDGETSEQLLAAADAAMYTAKGQGRNTYRHHRPNLHRHTDAEKLVDALRHGLTRREFELHFQPQIELRTQTASAVEALLRWRRSDGTLVTPAVFMSALEHSGLIVEVGRYALEAACAQLSAWNAEGRALRMAVNISACELRHRGFVPFLKKTLQTFHLQGPELELELTESQLATDNETTTHTMRQLRDLGVRLAIDDFGTGFVSLDYLRHVSLDSVKIDGSFVREIAERTPSLAIASAVIRLGERLGIDVIAEGVETYAQLDVLAREGCGYAQGYVCARPTPADHVFDEFMPGTLQWNSKPPPDDLAFAQSPAARPLG